MNPTVLFREMPPLYVLRDMAVDLGIVPDECRDWISERSWNGREPLLRTWTWFVHEGRVYAHHWWTGDVTKGYFGVDVGATPLGDGRFLTTWSGGTEVYVLDAKGVLRPEGEDAQ